MSVGSVCGRSTTCRVLIVQSYICCSCLSWWPLLPQFDSPGLGRGGGGNRPCALLDPPLIENVGDTVEMDEKMAVV